MSIPFLLLALAGCTRTAKPDDTGTLPFVDSGTTVPEDSVDSAPPDDTHDSVPVEDSDSGCVPDPSLYADADGDGYGGDPVEDCVQAGVAQAGDCDDSDANAFPGAPEIACNGSDDDCDGTIDEDAIALQSGASWRVSADPASGWEEVGYDDSSWEYAVAPAPENCGWTFIPDNLGRSYEAWEHEGTETMWSAGADTAVVFRMTFDVPDVTAVRSAMLTSIVDDEHTVYLNGVVVGHDDEPDGVPIVETDLSAALVPGENVLAIEAADLGGCRWAIADATITCQP